MTPIFEFTARGEAPASLVIHDMGLTLRAHAGPQPGVSASLLITAARSGDTLDDRGVPGWRSPVTLLLDTAPRPLALATRRDFGYLDGYCLRRPEAQTADGTLCHVEHAPFDALDMTLSAVAPASYRLAGTLTSTAGDALRLDVVLPVDRMSMGLSLDAETDADLRRAEMDRAEAALQALFDADALTWEWSSDTRFPGRTRMSLLARFPGA